MYKKIVYLVIMVVLLAIVSGCGSSVDKKLVGSWMDTEYGDILVLTNDGKMGMGYFAYTEDVTFAFRYTASRGSGEFWIVNKPEKKASFTYSISEDTLHFNVEGGDPSVGGDSSEFERIELSQRPDS